MEWARQLPPTSFAASPYCRHARATFSGQNRFVGVNEPYYVVAVSHLYRNCTAARWAADGIGWYRTSLDWSNVQKRRNAGFNFASYDLQVYELALHRIRFFPVLMYAPRWGAAKTTRGHGGTVQPPADDRLFAKFAAAAVRRYGPGGSFWRSHPRLPPEPISDWQVWNEPNLPYYWGGHTNPAAYTRLLKATYLAIKQVDRHADVITAGMPYFGTGPSAPSFYQAMMRDGAEPYFNGFAVHAYAPNPGAALRPDGAYSCGRECRGRRRQGDVGHRVRMGDCRAAEPIPRPKPG